MSEVVLCVVLVGRAQTGSFAFGDLSCRYMQIYNERVFDLLNPNATMKAAEKGKGTGGLRIRCGCIPCLLPLFDHADILVH